MKLTPNTARKKWVKLAEYLEEYASPEAKRSLSDRLRAFKTGLLACEIIGDSCRHPFVHAAVYDLTRLCEYQLNLIRLYSGRSRPPVDPYRRVYPLPKVFLMNYVPPISSKNPRQKRRGSSSQTRRTKK
jgi:hypothetical protein